MPFTDTVSEAHRSVLNKTKTGTKWETML